MEARFSIASTWALANLPSSLSNDEKLILYSYYKQAKEGKCETKQPSLLDLRGRAKWNAWKKLGDVSKEEAMRQYFLAMDRLIPDWETKARHTADDNHNDSTNADATETIEVKETSVPVPESKKIDGKNANNSTSAEHKKVNDEHEEDEEDAVEKDWQWAVDFVSNPPDLGAEIELYEMKLQFYGLYKVVNFGPCNIPDPGEKYIESHAKWEAWTNRGDMDKREAKKEYYTILTEKLGIRRPGAKCENDTKNGGSERKVNGTGASNKNNENGNNSSTEEDELIEKLYQEAVQFVSNPPDLGAEIELYEMKLQFYGLYKVVNFGPCNIADPGEKYIESHAKWEAWTNRGDMDKREAKKEYYAILAEKLPNYFDVNALTASLHCAPGATACAGENDVGNGDGDGNGNGDGDGNGNGDGDGNGDGRVKRVAETSQTSNSLAKRQKL